MENTVIKPHILTAMLRATNIHVDQGDKTILKVYKKLLKTTMQAALHFLIGRGSRCYEENHDQHIRDLKERIRIQATIIAKYIEKYGQLRLEDR